MEKFTGTVAGPEALKAMPEEYRNAVAKIVVSHAINELTGAETFDAPANRLAPSPRYKWLVSRVAMEEYGHHLLFARLAKGMGIDWRANKRPLTLFDYPMVTWVEFGVLKALGDLAEIIQLEDLMECSYLPLREVAVKTMPEERFHVGLGQGIVRDLLQNPDNRRAVQAAFDQVLPNVLPFFGKANSLNNALFQRWGIKRRTNSEMRREYWRRAEAFAREHQLAMPAVPEAYRSELMVQ